MKSTMLNAMGDKIKVSVFRNYHFNWRKKTCMGNCNTECAKYNKKVPSALKVQKNKLLPRENFIKETMKDKVVGLSFED